MYEEKEYNKGRESAKGQTSPASEFALHNMNPNAGASGIQAIPEGVVNGMMLGTNEQGTIK